jgi:hypothetical protein
VEWRINYGATSSDYIEAMKNRSKMGSARNDAVDWAKAAGLLLVIVYVIFFGVYSHAPAYDESMWQIDQRMSPWSWLFVLAPMVLLGFVLRKRRWNQRFLKPVLIATIMQPIIAFSAIYFESKIRIQATAVEPKQWFMVEQESSCSGKKRRWGGCKNYYQSVGFYNHKGEHFRAYRYAGDEKHGCALGQRVQSNSGQTWLNVERNYPIFPDRSFDGAITEKGRQEFIACTKQKVPDPKPLKAT